MVTQKKVTQDNEIKEDGLQLINNAATILYMRKNNLNSKSRSCPLDGVSEDIINYKNIKLLEQFVSERGKILPSRITGVQAKKQRALKREIKKARTLALLPFEYI